MLKSWLVFFALLPFTPSPQQPTPAPAPAASTIPVEAARMVNPIKATHESQAHIKKVWGYDCAMCHGESGNGKGDLVADLKLSMKDYTDAATLKDLSDGELFYIIKNGKGQMPSEGDRAKPDDIWNMVILVRSFPKK
ncbi:MAG TPA: cytochrome c [Edaphobacter sp.]|nr:cytochrome c [Edaphobacter sp.]